MFRDGTLYEGEFREDRAMGKCRMFLKEGETYVGENVDGLAEGEGRLTLLDGSYYEGQWKHNLKHGLGKETIIAVSGHSIILHATYTQGSIDPRFIAQLETPSFKYTGTLINRMFNNQGHIYYKLQGHQFTGSWLDNRKHGAGKYLFKDNTTLQGYFH